MSTRQINTVDFNKMTIDDAIELAEGLGVKVQASHSLQQVKKIIQDSGKITIKEGTKVKVHKTFGIYTKCKIHPTTSVDKGNTIHIGLNNYTVDIEPGIEIALPIKIIDFIKSCSTDKHFYDATRRGANGKMGVHSTMDVSKYIVETL